MNHSELKEIYTNIIVPEAEKILIKNPGLIFTRNAWENFAREYDALFEYYTKKYMSSSSDGMDSHKEISTIVISLLKTKPIKTVNSDYYEAKTERHAFNETLAFRVGCGVLTSIMAVDYRTKKDGDKDYNSYCAESIKQRIVFPDTTYQTYKQNVITEFYYTSREGSFNFLGISDKFFWIEYYNKHILSVRYKKKQRQDTKK